MCVLFPALSAHAGEKLLLTEAQTPQTFCPSPSVSALKINVLHPSGKPKAPRPLPKTGFPHTDSKSFMEACCHLPPFLGPEEQESAAQRFPSNSKGGRGRGLRERATIPHYSPTLTQTPIQAMWFSGMKVQVDFFFLCTGTGPQGRALTE